jgi:hypothetical protein
MRLSVSQLMEVAALLWEGSYLAKKKNCSGDSGSHGDGALGERTEGGGVRGGGDCIARTADGSGEGTLTEEREEGRGERWC